MATAACGHPCTGNNGTKTHKEHLKKTKDSRRRRAALLFLTNISLDGKPVCNLSNGNIGQRETGDTRSKDCWAPAGHSSSTVSSHGTVSLVSPSMASSVVIVVPPGTRLANPVRPTMVTSLGPLANYAVEGSELFISEGSTETILPPETPYSPIPISGPGPQLLSLSTKSPSVFSPIPSGPSADSRPRIRNPSGSPGPRVSKKVHFIKSMRQYDTRGSRIMLICAKRSLFAAFSVLPYGESYHLSDLKLDPQRRRPSSVVAIDLLPALEGVELSACGKTVSYAQFLYPTNALVRQKSNVASDNCALLTPQSRYRGNGQKNFTPARLTSTVAQDPSIDDLVDYDPNLLSDPQWPCGRHKRVLIFASYVTTIVEYVKPSDLKKDMNETFKEKFPHIKLTLSKIRSLKREMRTVGEECGLQPVTVAMAFVYFEKLILQGRLNKQNRKLVAAACVLLAAKISSDLRKPEVRQLFDKLEERFRINRRELIPLEFPVLVALEMGLYLPESMVMPHYRRLVQQG